MTNLELIGQLTENQAALTDKLTLAARAIDSLERRVDLFQAMLLHDPPHNHKSASMRADYAKYNERTHRLDSRQMPAGDNLDGLLDR